MPRPEILTAHRVVATPAALDAHVWHKKATILRLAPDEMLIIGSPPSIDDPAVIVEEEDGFCGVWLDRPEAADWLEREAEWTLPPEESELAQGMAAGLPVKVWPDNDRVLVITRTSLMAELERRL